MKKKIAILLALVCIFTAFTACGSSKKEMNAADLTKELLDGAGFVDKLDVVDDAVAVGILYGIDAADVKDVTVCCGTGATAEEIAVFEAVDEGAAGRILAKANERVAAQAAAYANYGAAAGLRVEDAVVRQSGSFVVVVICSDHDGAVRIVDQYI